MKKQIFSISAMLFLSICSISAFNPVNSIKETTANPIDKSTCTFKGKKLYGKIQVVNSFPDVKVKIVTSFPDLEVKVVNSFPDGCGKWQFVESFPDLKVQFVESFPDITIKYVESFPGVK